MNVVFFNDIQIIGGGEVWVLRMAGALSARGHQVSIVCPYRSQLFRAGLEAGVDLYGFADGPNQPFHEPLYHFLQDRKVDVVYCTVLGRFCEAQALGRLVRRLNANRADSTAILILKTGLPPMRGLSADYYGFGAPPEVRRLHVVSAENQKRFLQWQGGGEDVARFVTVMREGVDLSRFRRDGFERHQTRAEWQVEPDQLLIANTSRIQPAKGQEYLILAAPQVIRQRPHTRFILAGAGGYQPRLEDLCEQLKLQDHVTFAGHLPDVRPLLAASDIFCHPSLEDGLPNSVGEAMAMALPVVASRVGGIPEIITHEHNGLLVAPRNVEELTAALVRMADDPGLRARLGAQAAKDVHRHLDFENQVIRWEAAVAEELAQFRKQDHEVAAPAVYRPEIAYPVLFLMTHLRTGGEESEVAVLARHLNRNRFPLAVASAWAINEPSPAVDTLRRLEVPVDTACHHIPAVPEKAGYLVDKIRQEKIRLLVACQNTQLAYEVMGRLRPDECVLIEHAGIVGEVGQIPKDRTAIHIGVSPAITREAARLFTDPTKAHFLPSMVDTELFDLASRGRLRSAFGFNGKRVVLFVGRMDVKKGIHHLLDAAKELLPEFPDLLFLVVGPHDGYQIDYAQNLLDRAQRELPEGRFLFTGSRNDVPLLMCAADIFALPSVGEGMSHVINEAGAAALPVIAFDDGAAGEQLAGGAAGVLVPPGDLPEFVRGLRFLITDPQTAACLGKALQERVHQLYSAKVVGPQWETLFQKAGRGLTPVAHTPPLRARPDDTFPAFPAEIQIETNTICNATCIMCPYQQVSKELPKGRMDLSLYEKILTECARETTLRRIEPFLNNEPFTDPRIIDWIRLAKQMVPQAAVTITTNGSLLKPKDTDRLIHSGLDAIWFSFNGATKETYEKIMGLSFDTVKHNIDYLLSVKPNTLRVFTNMIDTVPMQGEVADNIRYWESRGVGSGVSPLVNRAGNVSNFERLNYQPISERPVRTCDLVFHKMYVGYNGDVLLCCMDWRRKVVLGNVRLQSLREIWNGTPYRRYRRFLEQGRSRELELCSVCTYIRS